MSSAVSLSVSALSWNEEDHFPGSSQDLLYLHIGVGIVTWIKDTHQILTVYFTFLSSEGDKEEGG